MKRRDVLQCGWIVAAVIAGLALGAGCGRDARLVGKRLRDPRVRTVEHYGIRLDENATPKQVVDVLLRAFHADVNAGTSSAREDALDVQFDVCAANTLAALKHPGRKREEWLYQIVSSWAPAVAHYLRGDESRVNSAIESIVVVTHPATEDLAQSGANARVALIDPEDPNAGVYLVVHLVQEPGTAGLGAPPPKYWRVSGIYFQPGRRPGQPGSPAARPGSATGGNSEASALEASKNGS